MVGFDRKDRSVNPRQAESFTHDTAQTQDKTHRAKPVEGAEVRAGRLPLQKLHGLRKVLPGQPQHARGGIVAAAALSPFPPRLVESGLLLVWLVCAEGRIEMSFHKEGRSVGAGWHHHPTTRHTHPLPPPLLLLPAQV